MDANILPLPQPWPAGSQQQVAVDITGAPAGQTVTVELFRSMPKPDQSLGNKSTIITSSGTGSATFSVTLNSPGINVLHCEVTSGNDSDGDSAGTIVK